MNSIVLSTTIPAASSSNVAITGAGFAPKAAVLLFGGQNQDGTGIGVANSVSFATSTAQAGASFRNIAARTTNVQSRSVLSSSVVHTVWNSTGTVLGQCAVASFDSDGITLSIGTQFTVAAQVSVLLLGGSDLTASVGTFQLPSATGSNTPVTGLTHTPNVVLVATANRGVTTLGTASNNITGLSFGYATASAQASVSVAPDASSTNAEAIESWVATDAFIVNDSPVSGLQERATFTAFTSDGFTLNKTANNGTAGGQVAYLALTVPAATAGTTSARTDTNTTTLTTTGVTPKALFMIARPPATAADSTAATGTNDGQFNVGIASGASNRASLSLQVLEVAAVPSGPTESFNRLPTDAIHAHYSRSALNTYTLDGSMDVQAFGSESITLMQDDADTVASILPYLVLGDTVSASARFRPYFITG